MSPNAPEFEFNSLLDLIDEPNGVIEPLSSGASCDVWRILGHRNDYALRVFTKRHGRCPLPIEIAVRDGLAKRGAAVATPIATSLDHPTINPATAWSLDTFVAGTFCARGALPARAAQDLGRTLAILHAIPTKGFGRLLAMEPDSAIGTERAAHDAVHCRFDKPLPNTEHDWKGHPLMQHEPGLRAKMQPLINQVIDAQSASKAAICHGDLHEQQLICSGEKLAALIDFADATVLDRRWDFASLYYFHGRDVLHNALIGYSRNEAERKTLANDAKLFSIGIAVHHAARSRLPGKEHRLAAALKHIAQVLKTASPSASRLTR